MRCCLYSLKQKVICCCCHSPTSFGSAVLLVGFVLSFIHKCSNAKFSKCNNPFFNLDSVICNPLNVYCSLYTNFGNNVFFPGGCKQKGVDKILAVPLCSNISDMVIMPGLREASRYKTSLFARILVYSSADTTHMSPEGEECFSLCGSFLGWCLHLVVAR